MDLLSLDIDNAGPRFLHLKHPVTGKPLMDDKEAVGIEMHGADSEVFRRAQARARLQAVRDKKAQGELEDADDAELDALADEVVKASVDRTSDVLAAVTSKVLGLSVEGKAVTPKNIGTYFRRMTWLRDQADAFTSDTANFMPRAKKD